MMRRDTKIKAAMETDFSALRVVIYGLGLMGGSLAMALSGKCQVLYGIDPDPETLSLARSSKIVMEASHTAEEWFSETDLIVLAAPVKTNLSLLNEIQRIHPSAAMILDLGSTKVRITEAMASLPDQFDPIGGHPMCGKEHGGIINADPLIFLNAPFAFTPLARSSREVRIVADELARAIGAVPIWLNAETHDRWIASTSHLPYLIANALAAITPEDARFLVGPGFRSTARLAPSPWSVMGDILETNRANILARMQQFRVRFQEMETMLANDDFEALKQYLEEGSRRHEDLVE
jgi:prephenate dehydrogenase